MGLCPLPIIYLGPNCGVSLVARMVKNPPATWETWVRSLGWEDPLEKGKATHSSIPAWRIPWASLGQSLGSLLLSPGSCCMQGSVCALKESVSPVLCKFWWLYGGVNNDLLQEGLCHTQVCWSPAPVSVYCWPVPPQETLKHSSVSVSVVSLGPDAHKVCLSPLSISGGYGVWF